jgi:hypothetical protein
MRHRGHKEMFLAALFLVVNLGNNPNAYQEVNG